MLTKKDQCAALVFFLSVTAVMFYAIAMILILAYDSWGADAQICFDEATASRMVVELESSRIMAKELEQCQVIANSQETIATAWKEASNLFKVRAQKSEEYAKQLKDLWELQSKAYEQAIKDAQPSIWEEIGKAAAFIGVGVLIGILAL